jgi:hypothetical protein
MRQIDSLRDLLLRVAGQSEPVENRVRFLGRKGGDFLVMVEAQKCSTSNTFGKSTADPCSNMARLKSRPSPLLAFDCHSRTLFPERTPVPNERCSPNIQRWLDADDKTIAAWCAEKAQVCANSAAPESRQHFEPSERTAATLKAKLPQNRSRVLYCNYLQQLLRENARRGLLIVARLSQHGPKHDSNRYAKKVDTSREVSTFSSAASAGRAATSA